ncbi:MAG TPA: NosD domain-containing protein [Opitutus sp.]|nr:NosD domain-containing protein [Opitutus sp.]
MRCAHPFRFSAASQTAVGLALAIASSVALHAETAGDGLRARIEAAQPGAVIVVAAGVYEGPFVIDKSIRIQGKPGATLEGTGRGHVVDVRAADVELSGFVIRHSGSNLSTDDAGVHLRAPRAWIHHNTIVDTLHGIYVRQAPEARLTNNVIRGRAAPESIADPLTNQLKLSSAELCSVTLEQNQRGNGIHIWNCANHLIEDNDIRGTRDGIYFSFCDETTVRRNVIREVRYGLHYMYSDNNVFEDNLFTDSAAGSALMYSTGITLQHNRFLANRSHRAYGLLLHSVETTRIERNFIQGNTVGLFLENCIANTVVGNTVAGNYIGVRLSDSSDENQFSANSFRENIHAVETSGVPTSNTWSIAGVGNYWEEALKLDLDRNGIADVPHYETDLFGRWRRLFPEIGLLSGSPGERALRFVHTRIHLPGVPGVKDERPLVRRILP